MKIYQKYLFIVVAMCLISSVDGAKRSTKDKIVLSTDLWMNAVNPLMQAAAGYRAKHHDEPQLICKDCLRPFLFTEFLSNLLGMSLVKWNESANAFATIKSVFNECKELFIAEDKVGIAVFMIKTMNDCNLADEHSSCCAHCHGTAVNPYVEDTAEWQKIVEPLQDAFAEYHKQCHAFPQLICKDCQKSFAYTELYAILRGIVRRKIMEGADLGPIKAAVDEFKQLLLTEDKIGIVAFMMRTMSVHDLIPEHRSNCLYCHGALMNPYSAS